MSSYQWLRSAVSDILLPEKKTENRSNLLSLSLFSPCPNLQHHHLYWLCLNFIFQLLSIFMINTYLDAMNLKWFSSHHHLTSLDSVFMGVEQRLNVSVFFWDSHWRTGFLYPCTTGHAFAPSSRMAYPNTQLWDVNYRPLPPELCRWGALTFLHPLFIRELVSNWFSFMSDFLFCFFTLLFCFLFCVLGFHFRGPGVVLFPIMPVLGEHFSSQEGVLFK